MSCEHGARPWQGMKCWYCFLLERGLQVHSKGDSYTGKQVWQRVSWHRLYHSNWVLQDGAAAAGVRALHQRIHLSPSAVHDFLQAGGISAAVTILSSQLLHTDLQDAAVALLQAVLLKLPGDASAAFP